MTKPTLRPCLSLVFLLLATGFSTVHAQTAILSENFEGVFPGTWSVGDANSAGTAAYWKDVNAVFGGEGAHTGSWKGYCAGIGYAGDSINPTYQNDMSAYLSRTIDLSGYAGATLTFWYKIPSLESCCDRARVVISSIDSVEVWSSSATASAWTQVTIDLAAYVGAAPTLTFQFDTDSSITDEGWYLDDILVTGVQPPANDDCSAPLPLPDNTPYLMSTEEATADTLAPSCQSTVGRGVWFSFTPGRTGPVEVSTCGSDFDTVLQIFTGQLCRLTPLGTGGCSDDNGPACSGQQASLRFEGTAGVTYIILAGGYNAAAGNLLITARTVDETPPDIICPPNLFLDTDPGQCSRANVTFAPTASDNVGVVSLVCTPPSGSTFAEGDTSVQCTATDAAGNTSTCSFTVSVRDVGQPTLQLPENIVVETEGLSASVAFSVTASDICDAAPTVTCDPPSGSVFPLGTTLVACTALDASGNSRGGQFTVTVNQTGDAPVVVAQPESVTVSTRESASFEVTATGPLPLAYQWFLDGRAIPNATASTYDIEHVTPLHLGAYTVRVTNSFGSVISEPADLTPQFEDKVDRWASQAVRDALETLVYADLRDALESEGFEPVEWKAVVGWGLNLEGRDPRPVCQIIRVPCISPPGSDPVAMIGVMLGIGAYEDGELIAPPPIVGGVALVADPTGGQRMVLRILCDADGVGRPLEQLDDGCLAEWLAAVVTPVALPTYEEIVEDIVLAGVACSDSMDSSGAGLDSSCHLAANAMGWFTYWAMSVCLPPDWDPPYGDAAAPAPIPEDSESTLPMEGSFEAAGAPPVIDGTHSCCVYDPNLGSKLGGILGGAFGAETEAAGWVVTKLGQLVSAIDDTKEWCSAQTAPYAVLEGIVGHLQPGGFWLGNADSLPTHFSAEDSTFTHSSLDWIINVVPFRQDEAWPGSPNYAALASQFNRTDADGLPELECEWETLYIPNFIRTFPGDRVWMRGQHIFDCGHPVGFEGVAGFRSEIHPPHALVIVRQEGSPLNTDGMSMPASVARVYITPWGGEANNPDNINGDGRVWSTGAAGTPRFDAAHTPYQIRIPIPFKPNHSDLTPIPGAPLAVYIEPAEPLAQPGLTTTYGGGLRITRRAASHPFLQQVLDDVSVSLLPNAADPDYLLVTIPLTNGPIPNLGGEISPIQFKVAVGWDDAPLALKVAATMPIMDALGEFEIAAPDSPAVISPAHPFESGRTWVPPDRRTVLRVTGPDAAWQIKPVRVDITDIHVSEESEGASSAEFYVFAGVNGNWVTLPGLNSVEANSDYAVNVSVPVDVYTGYSPHLDIMAAGYEMDGMDYSLDQDDTLGRLFATHQGAALGVSPTPYLAVPDNGGNYNIDYGVFDREDPCSLDQLDPMNDLVDTATGISPPGLQSYVGLRVGPQDTADWFALDTDDYMTLSATLTDQTAQNDSRCRTYDLQVVTERAVIPPDRFDDGLVGDVPCSVSGTTLRIEEFAGRNDAGWATSPILHLCPAAVTEADLDCIPMAPMQEFFPDNLWLDTLNFHLPYPGINSTPDVDYYRIQLPDVQESCDAVCPAILSGKLDPAALTILIEGDRDRPVLVSVTNFMGDFLIDNDPATPATNSTNINGREFSISRTGTRTLIQLECPRGSGAFPDGLVGLVLSDPEGQRNFYNLRASYQIVASCDVSKLLISPDFADLIVGKLWGAVDPPPDIRFLPMMTVADPAQSSALRGQTMPFQDGPAENGAWTGQDRWLVMLPRGRTTMEITVDAPPGADPFDVGIELRNLADQPIAQAVEIGRSIGNTPISAPAESGTTTAVPSASETYGGPSPRKYQLILPPMDGCFYFLKVIRPQAGGTFTAETTTTTAPEITVNPGSLSFGNRCLGVPSPQQSITIHNFGTADLIVSNIDLAGLSPLDFSLGNLPVLPAKLQPGAEVSFTLGFEPTQPGARQADVVILCNDSTTSTLVVSATGAGQEDDIDPPHLQCPSDIVVWTCADGASVPYNVSATDDCDTNLTVVCTPASGSWFTLGTNPVVCSVTNSSGQSEQCAFTVTVMSDTEPPTIYCPTGRVVHCMGATGALVYYPVEAGDNSIGSIALSCAPASGSWFPIGETLVTCQAIDSCGNVGQCTFPVIVLDSPPVPLAIEPATGQMRVTWPASCLAYSLQTATNLDAPAGWSPPQDPPISTGGGFSTTVQPTNSAQYFRLLRNP